MTLMELTGHEAGIVIYESGEVAVVNWGQYDDDQVPRLTPMLGMFGFPEDGILDNVPVSETVEDVRDILPGKVWMDDGELDTDMEILQDDNNDIIATGIGVPVIPTSKAQTIADYFADYQYLHMEDWFEDDEVEGDVCRILLSY